MEMLFQRRIFHITADLPALRFKRSGHFKAFSDAFTVAMEFLEEYPQDVDMNREVSFLSSRL